MTQRKTPPPPAAEQPESSRSAAASDNGDQSTAAPAEAISGIKDLDAEIIESNTAEPPPEAELPSPIPSMPLRYVVAVGASAGGLEALEDFVGALNQGTGMAYVIIQHLSPDYASRMDELLSRRTTLRVKTATHGERIAADTIYLGVGGQEMIVSGGRLLLTARSTDEVFSLPIDHFFRSLANDYGEQAIAIILSGTGSDGTRGLREVHAAGGLTICQPPETAKFGGMPRSALDSGMVDLVLPPHQIPLALLKHANLVPPDQEPGRGAIPSAPTEEVGPLERIFHLLHRECSIDFSNYKPTTVTRRIQRRQQLTQKHDLESYAEYLANTPDERDELYRDLLIGVTGFFRDSDVYEGLYRQVIVPLVRKRTGQEIRVWVAGCATGEEAYSIAILVHEAAEALKLPVNLKLFATDVHATSLDKANLGVYDSEALRDVSSERLARFFVQVSDDRWKITKELRASVVFARHNVLTDAPFTRLDLVTCRNLMIYLQPVAQKRVLTLFHFSLLTGGVLFLGTSETPGALNDEFEPIHRTDRVYQKRRDIRLPQDNKTALVSPFSQPRGRGRGRGGQSANERQLSHLLSRILDDQVAPSLLIDEDHRLIHSFAGAEKYLRVPSGRATSMIVDMVDPKLRTPLSGALQQCQKQHKVVRYTGVAVAPAAGEEEIVELTVRPYVDEGSHTAYLVQLTATRNTEPAPTTLDVQGASTDYVRSLEEDLQHAQENLQATVEELETSNEELQATNEELVASNEELQSTNEELHSVNEELYSVNSEHQLQIKELTQLTSDLDNLFKSIDIGVLFLDRQRRIRRFTRRMAESMHLESGDIGRSIDHFDQNVDASLGKDIRRVMSDMEPIEREVHLRDDTVALLRIVPYRARGEVEGAIVTLVDITELAHSVAEVGRLSSVVAHSTDAIISLETTGAVATWNRGAEAMFGIKEDEARGRHLSELLPEEEPGLFAESLSKAFRGVLIKPYETTRSRSDTEVFELSESVSPLYDEKRRLIGVGIIMRDITRLRRAERSVRQAVKQRDKFIAILSHELRNPLMGIQAGLDLLESTHGEQKAHEVLNRQVRQMSRILDDLLDVTRMRRDKLEMRRERVDLGELLGELQSSMTPRIAESGVKFELELPDVPMITHADPARMQQLIVNLVGNALKFTPAGRRVKVSLAHENADALLIVSDDGKGIESEQLDGVFDPFCQGVDVEPGVGMGLGLALARGIARAHGGDITASSPGRGCGATFIARIPLAIDSNQKHQSSPPSSKAARAKTRSRRILVVEDDEDNRSLMEMLLNGRGHEVTGVGDGSEAVDLFHREDFDVALVDLGLPGKGGLQVAEEVRDRAEQLGTHLIALTGHGTQKDRVRVHDAGFHDHLVKPVSFEVLRALIEQDSL